MRSAGHAARLLNEHRALLILAALFALLSAAAPNFLSVDNVTAILKGASLNAVVAVGFTLVLILGQLDLSIGAVVMLCGMLTVGLQPSLGWPGCFAVALAAGGLVGLVNGWQDLRSAFGIIANNMEYDGKVVDWYTHPKIKDFLLYNQDLYARGLIHPEIFTLEGGAKWEMINKGMSGVHAETSTNALNAWANNRPPLSLLAAIPEAKLLMIPGVADEEGKTPRLKAYSAAGGEKFFVNADVSDEKLIEILKFFEFCNFSSDDQTKATLWYGEEGVDWKWQDGKPVKTSEIQSGDKGTMVFCRNIQLGKLWEWLTFEPMFEAGRAYYIKEAGGKWNGDLEYQHKLDIYGKTRAAEISGEYGTDWGNVRNAYFMAVVMGEKNVEGDWDAYIKELTDLHYGEYLEELEKAPTVEEIIAQFAD